MSVAAVMVYVDSDADSDNRIRVGAGIAAQCDAALLGVAGWPLRHLDSAETPASDTPAIEAGPQEQINKALAALEERFRHVAGKNAKGVEWRSSIHFPREFIVEQARAADLIVLGQDPLPGDVYRTYDPGTVILASGRPVLVVPRGIGLVRAARVMIAWKNTREARRAVRDALPFLRRAESVCIASVNEAGAKGLDAEIADVKQYLARHGVPIGKQIATMAKEREGDLLLDLAAQHNADLIVAGGYGRTRLSEWVFGGVTRHLLTACPVACLFSN